MFEQWYILMFTALRRGDMAPISVFCDNISIDVGKQNRRQNQQNILATTAKHHGAVWPMETTVRLTYERKKKKKTNVKRKSSININM